MTLIVLSMVPLAFAEGNGPSSENDTEEDTAVVIEEADDNGSEEETILGKGKPKEKIVTSTQIIPEAKERYQEAKDDYLEAKQKIQQSKVKLRDCQEDASEDCEQLRTNSRTFLSASAGKILGSLATIRERVQNSEDLSDEEKAEILANLEESIYEIEDAQAVTDNLNEDSTDAEIRKVAQTIRDAWRKTVQTAAKRAVGKLANAKIHGIIVRSEKLEIKLETMLENLEEQGYDVSAASEYLDDFLVEINKANVNYESAREQYTQSGKVDEANKLMKSAHKDLQEAHAILKNLLRTIKDTKESGLEELEEVEEVEDEEAAEDEEESEADN